MVNRFKGTRLDADSLSDAEARTLVSVTSVFLLFC